KPDRTGKRLWHALDRHERRAGRGMLERLAHFPRPLQPLGGSLQIAARHIETDPVTKYVAHGIARRDAAAARIQGDDQLDVVMHISGGRWIGKDAVGDDVVWVLLKEEGRLLTGIVSHLDCVLGIVTPDAVNAVDRK